MNLNVYDSVALKDIREPRVRMFGAANIGKLEYTNLAAPSAVSGAPGETYAVLQNWYARIAVSRPTHRIVRTGGASDWDDVWQEWVNATTITLVLGAMPVHQLPLADLLRRYEGQRNVLAGDMHPASDVEIARLMFDTYSKTTVLALRAQRGDPPPPAFGSWDAVLGDGGPHDAERMGWVAAAAMARSLLCAPVLCVVPCRQIVYVALDTDMAKTGRVLEAVPTDTLRVWVHLEGISCLDTDPEFPKS